MAPSSVFRTQDVFSDYLAENVWLPILAISAAVLIVIMVVYCIWRCWRNPQYDYTILKADLALPQKLEMERKLQYDTMRETALLHCQFYLRSSGLYAPVEHLFEIGSRVNKHWFLVRDTRSKAEKLLTMVPRGRQMVLPFTSATRNTLLALVQTIQHPYIYPIYDLDLLVEQDRVVVILPYNSKGSMKDVIYHAHCMDSWSSKYSMTGTGLMAPLVAKYGRQILEGMIFMQKSGFPPLSHLHSGNIVVQNNTCRLTGYENDLLGLSPKMYGMTTKILRDDRSAIEVVCFGHLLYEMSVGNELEVTIPESRHLHAVQDENIRKCLQYIFSASADGFHTLEKICEHPFFKSVALQELEVFKRPPVKFSKSQKALLKAIKRSKPIGQRKPSAPSTVYTPTTEQPERRRSTPRQDSGQNRFQLPPPRGLPGQGLVRKPPSSLAPLTRKPPPPSSKPAPPSSKPSLPSVKSTDRPPVPAKPRSSPLVVPSAASGERTALLNQIRQGPALRRVQPTDRNPRV